MQQSVLSLAALAASVFSASGAAQCDRETLVAATTSLVEAQTAGKPDMLGALANVPYLEQFKTANPTKGILATPLALDFNRSLHDTVQCTTYTEMIAAKTSHPYVIGTQMHFTPEGVLTNFSSLVTDQGDWLFNATGTLYWASREKWDVIPEGQRDTRETIKAAADAYADIFNDKSVKVPWLVFCISPLRQVSGLVALRAPET